MNKTGKYNERVRQRISDEYVAALKHRAEYVAQRNELLAAMEADGILHSDYKKLQKELDAVKLNLVKIVAIIDTWDKAREICLEVGDEVY